MHAKIRVIRISQKRKIDSKIEFDFLIRSRASVYEEEGRDRIPKRRSERFRGGYGARSIVSHGHTSIFMVNRVKYTRGKSEPPPVNQAILLPSPPLLSPPLLSRESKAWPTWKTASAASFYNGSRYNEPRYAAFPLLINVKRETFVIPSSKTKRCTLTPASTSPFPPIALRIFRYRPSSRKIMHSWIIKTFPLLFSLSNESLVYP